MNSSVLMIVPAAGMSTRYPPNKLTVKIDDVTVIEKTLKILCNYFSNVVLVVGHDKEMVKLTVKKSFNDSVKIIENPQYKSGMSSSIHRAIINTNSDEFEYFGFCNADKPFIKQKTIDLLLQVLDQEQPKILVPTFRGINGHPNFFSTAFKKILLNTTGDVGGRNIIMQNIAETHFLEVADHGVTLDMDQYLNGEPDEK